ncbi:Negative modulator of initiation of replication [Paraglaciecola hydrolytica]|uniref:Negative modulator of initiation of replication n=1 Tax=Paraglaciecola hydrolytica TaxID=1799789 RepID=A0A136A0N6_9ALTE|nr:Negative modulator of initiation of replication [Paraglaciecola hydrolytica]KXI28781.1 Negative modulator of initiation of replication [Paraglaciecola hydrolytica]
MKTIEIEEDLYHFIASQTQHIGESASDILRRLVMPNSPVAPKASAPKVVINNESVAAHVTFLSELEKLDLLEMPKVVNRFLAVLGLLHHHHASSFAGVLNMSGRNRTYFATSKEALLATGSSTNPKQVPDSEYWVITNNNTQKKVTMIKEVALLLGYSGSQVEKVVNLFCPEEQITP